jgi:hypothetical protein
MFALNSSRSHFCALFITLSSEPIRLDNKMCLQEHFVSFQNIVATIYLLNIADGVILATVCKIVDRYGSTLYVLYLYECRFIFYEWR